MLFIALLAIITINGIIILLICFYFMKQSFIKRRYHPTYSLNELKVLIPSLSLRELKVLRLIVSEEIKRYSPPELLTITKLIKIHAYNLAKAGRKTIKTYLPEINFYSNSLKSFSKS